MLLHVCSTVAWFQSLQDAHSQLTLGVCTASAVDHKVGFGFGETAQNLVAVPAQTWHVPAGVAAFE